MALFDHFIGRAASVSTTGRLRVSAVAPREKEYPPQCGDQNEHNQRANDNCVVRLRGFPIRSSPCLAGVDGREKGRLAVCCRVCRNDPVAADPEGAREGFAHDQVHGRVAEPIGLNI